MGKILLVNTGPSEAESNSPSGDVSGLPIKWAEAASKALKQYKVDALYACPAPGVPGIARIIAATFNLEIQTMPGLEGLDNAQWNMQGMDRETAEDYADKQSPVETGINSPFGANIEAVRSSAGSALDMLAEKHKKEGVVIVSHRALSVIMVLHLLHMHNKHYWQVAQDAGAISLFEVRSGMPSALIINDTCHLHGLI
ncbi:MAG: histidine phosphatase family protein [Dehalococcoidia bacterium]|nr:histidine phosphatase family protein [Dehalococcoidia bacterium]